MNKRALGLIEVHGYLGAIEAADIALKAANVNLIGCEVVNGGLVTVKLEGDVSSVKAAVEAAETAMIKLNILVGAHVIARPDSSVWDLLCEDTNSNDKTDEELLVIEEKESNEDLSVIDEISNEINEVELEDIGFQVNTLEITTEIKEQLESKKVNELRALARSLNLDNMTKKQIKFARKDRLVEEIILFYQRRNN